MSINFNEVFERIKQATNTRTQVELAEVLDIRQSSISDAKRRNSVPSDWYMKLFEKFGLNPDWLKRAVGPRYLRSPEGEYKPFDVPETGELFEDQARYGDPATTGIIVTVYSMQCKGSDAEGWTPKPESKLNIPLTHQRTGLLVLHMDSSSMEPFIRRGALVGIDREQTNIVTGELYGVYVPYEGLTVKRIFLDAENGRFILRSEANGHPDQHLPVEKHEGRIVGRVSWVLQSL